MGFLKRGTSFGLRAQFFPRLPIWGDGQGAKYRRPTGVCGSHRFRFLKALRLRVRVSAILAKANSVLSVDKKEKWVLGIWWITITC